MSSQSADVAANMRAAAEAFIMAFDGRWSASAALAPTAPECEHIILPASLGIPTRSNADWAIYMEQVEKLGIVAEMTINDSIVVPDERRAVYRSSMTSTTCLDFVYNNEYIFILKFDFSGRKIVSVTEFMDSRALTEALEKFKKAGLM